MQSRLPLIARAILLATLSTLGSSQAFAHGDPGSTQGVVPIPNVNFMGEAFLSIPVMGPPAGAEEILHSTLDLTWTTPSGDFPLTSGTPTWVVHGHELGWPAAYGTFSATLDTDAFNGVLAGPSGMTTWFHMHLGSATGSTFGQFVDSTLTLELAGEVCQTDLGFAGPGLMRMQICGEPLGTGQSAELLVTRAPPSAPVFLAISTTANPAPFYGGQLVPLPLLAILTAPADATGTLSLVVPGGSGPVTAYVQAVAEDASAPFGYVLSNALEVDLLP
jgi:hypothetical protein